MELVKKAYWVGTSEHLSSLNLPECPAELILADPDMPLGRVKQLMIFGYEYSYTDLRAQRAPAFDLYKYDDRQLTQGQIVDLNATLQWRSELVRFVELNQNAKVLIYSGEHMMWWRSNGCGYTAQKEQAGIYDINDAWNRIHHVDASKKIKLEIWH